MNINYSDADLISMQREAEQRVFEMQRRAQQTLCSEESDKKTGITEESQCEEDFPRRNAGETLLDILGRDNERALLTLLLIILTSENANKEIILTLMYLLVSSD